VGFERELPAFLAVGGGELSFFSERAIYRREKEKR
jgi:hypothetical protein